MVSLPKRLKIDKRKISALKEGLIPYNVTLSELDEVLGELEKPETKFKDQLLGNVIIGIVTLIEDTIKHDMKYLIDSHNLDVSSLVKISEPVGNYSKGVIVATNFNFQNLNDIDLVYTKLLRLKFLETLKEFVSSPASTGAADIFAMTSFRDPDSLAENWDNFRNLFTLRHEIVHTISSTITIQPGSPIARTIWHDSKVSLNNDYLRRILNSTEVFLFSCITLSDLILRFNKGLIYNIKIKNFLSERSHKKSNSRA